MKKFLLFATKLIVVALLFTCNVNAQKASAPIVSDDSLASQNLMAVVHSPIAIKTREAAAPELNVRAIKDFGKQYKDVANAKWYQSGTTTVASFEQNGILTRVVYLKSGRCLHSLISYDETHLASDIKSIISENFRYHQIIWVTEVHENAKVFYFINIEAKKNFKQVIVSDGEVTVYKDFDKEL